MSSLYLNLQILLDEDGKVYPQCSKLSRRLISQGYNKRSPAQVEALLDTLKGFDKNTLKVVQEMRLPHLGSIPREVQDLWEKSTTTWPRLFPAERCWTKPPPSPADLILATLTCLAQCPKPDGAFTTYRRGEPDSKVDPRTAIAQLYELNASDPTSLIGLNVPELPDDILKCPEALSQYVEPFDENGHQLLLTPKFSQTDLHIDSADGLSVPVGQCIKIWLAFPPTPKNLAHMYGQQGRKGKLQSIGASLEGGLIFQTTSAEGVYLPVGTIHAVLTTTGGFLNALDFTMPDSSKAYAALFTAGVDRADEGFQRDCFRHFLKAAELGLDNQRESMAVEAWVGANERIKEYGMRDAGWRRGAMVVWEDYLGREVDGVVCPCGKGLGDRFPAHCRVEHLWKAVGSKRPLGGRSSRISAPRRTLARVMKPNMPPLGIILRSRVGREKRKPQEDDRDAGKQRPVKKAKR